jgi:hypothetical protein
MRRVVTSYSNKAMKQRATLRTKCRLTPDDWDKCADYACILSKVVQEVRNTTGLDETVVEVLKKSFLAGCAQRAKHMNVMSQIRVPVCLVL